MGRFDDMTVYTTPTTLERFKGLYGYTIGQINDGQAILVFPNILRAANFAEQAPERVTLIGEVKSFAEEVIVTVRFTPHHTDLCDDCGGCQRNACEAHRLCYC